MSDHKKENPASNQEAGSPMGPDALNKTSTSVDPNSKEQSDSTEVQNANQNNVTVSGNQIKGNTPGGNINEVQTSRVNKPRSSPNPSQQNQK